MVDFNQPDTTGYCPLHVAAECGSLTFARCLLQSGCDPTPQTDHADQPSHIAARLNNVDMLKLLCLYDTHINRLNHSHLSPLGTARMFFALEVVDFLVGHYKVMQVGEGGAPCSLNSVGNVWWEKDFEDVVDEWTVHTDTTGNRTFKSKYTEEMRLTPPILSAYTVSAAAQNNEIPLRRVIEVMKDDEEVDDALNIRTYRTEQKVLIEEIRDLSNSNIAALRIQTIFRKYHQLKYLERRKFLQATRMKIKKFIVERRTNFKRWKIQYHNILAIKIQKTFRGFYSRRHYFHSEEFKKLQDTQLKLKLNKIVSRAWKNYRMKKERSKLSCMSSAPRTLVEWRKLVKEIRTPVRVIGVVAEYLYPNTSISFYCHTVTGHCSFGRLLPLEKIIQDEDREATEVRVLGHTTAEGILAAYLQKLWKSYKGEKKRMLTERISVLSSNAESAYLISPQVDRNMYNYALTAFNAFQDYSLASSLLRESMVRMEGNGPDLGFVLYTYAVYGFVSHEMDYTDVVILLERARVAEKRADEEMKVMLKTPELSDGNYDIRGPAVTAMRSTSITATENIPGEILNRKRFDKKTSLSARKRNFHHGVCYETAHVGYYQQNARTLNNAEAWHQLASVEFLVFNNFDAAFIAFMEAQKLDKRNAKIRSNFAIMMARYHGNDGEHIRRIINDKVILLGRKVKTSI